MQIDEFERRVVALLSYRDEDGIQWVEDALRIYPAADGCMSATFQGQSIQCEEMPWSAALDAIVNYLEERKANK